MSAERKQARNLYYDKFAEKYEFHYRMPYSPTQADFVQLHHLTTNSGKLSERLTLEVWTRGVSNYFASELGSHTLKHLCSMFVPFWRNPMDRYGKPKETASKAGAEPTGQDWHGKFLAMCWAVAQKDKSKLDQVTELMETVCVLDQAAAFRALKIIENTEPM